MPAAVVNPLGSYSREINDCAIGALAMYLGLTYEDVLRAVSVLDRAQGRRGLTTREIMKVAKHLGTPLRRRATVDLHEDYGLILWEDHVTLLRNGLVIDAGVNGGIWEAEDYQSRVQKGAAPEGILIEAK